MSLLLPVGTGTQVALAFLKGNHGYEALDNDFNFLSPGIRGPGASSLPYVCPSRKKCTVSVPLTEFAKDASRIWKQV